MNRERGSHNEPKCWCGQPATFGGSCPAHFDSDTGVHTRRPKQCAACGAPVPTPTQVVIFEGVCLAGVPSDRFVVLRFCKVRCAFELGARHAGALSTGHTLALEPEQYELCETEEQARQLAEEA